MSRPTRETASGRVYLDLQNLARREGRGTQELLTQYVVERWLARLSGSAYANDFVLKGGILLAAFGQRRPTADADALARNMASDQEHVTHRVAEIAALASEGDGVTFRPGTVRAGSIREGARYSGVRVTMDAQIGTAVVKLRLDVNFGDPISPGPQIVELPSLRPGEPSVRVLGYPIETVLAEKIVTAIELGAANTRVRDFVDIFTLTGSHDVDRASTRAAITTTAAFRDVELVPLAGALGNLVSLRAGSYVVYRDSLGRYGEHLPPDFEEVVSAVIAFADELTGSYAGAGRWESGTRTWMSA